VYASPCTVAAHRPASTPLLWGGAFDRSRVRFSAPPFRKPPLRDSGGPAQSIGHDREISWQSPLSNCASPSAKPSPDTIGKGIRHSSILRGALPHRLRNNTSAAGFRGDCVNYREDPRDLPICISMRHARAVAGGFPEDPQFADFCILWPGILVQFRRVICSLASAPDSSDSTRGEYDGYLISQL
jgi:hypothetical protein